MEDVELTAGVFNVLAETYSIIGQNHGKISDENKLYNFLFDFFLIEDKAKFSKLLDTTKKDIEVFGFGNDNKDSVSQGSVESYGFLLNV